MIDISCYNPDVFIAKNVYCALWIYLKQLKKNQL